jgi:hypothetical protein
VVQPAAIRFISAWRAAIQSVFSATNAVVSNPFGAVIRTVPSGITRIRALRTGFRVTITRYSLQKINSG